MLEPPVPVTDPKALRALAHPVRLALLGLLRREGPKTATEAAPLVGQSIASCSFHLRQLGKYGLVQPAGDGTGRARPWRATALLTSFSLDPDDPEQAAASAAFAAILVGRYADLMLGAVQRFPLEPKPWREASLMGDSILHLTADELAALKREIEATLKRYADRLSDPAQRPNGSRLVTFIHWAMPDERRR